MSNKLSTVDLDTKNADLRATKLDRHLARMDKDDYRIAMRWLTETRGDGRYAYSARAVAHGLTEGGYDVGPTLVKEWRQDNNQNGTA